MEIFAHAQQSQMAIPCTVVQEHSQMFTKLNCTHSLSRTLIPHAYFLPRTFTNIPTQSLPSACNMQSAPGWVQNLDSGLWTGLWTGRYGLDYGLDLDLVGPVSRSAVLLKMTLNPGLPNE